MLSFKDSKEYPSKPQATLGLLLQVVEPAFAMTPEQIDQAIRRLIRYGAPKAAWFCIKYGTNILQSTMCPQQA